MSVQGVLASPPVARETVKTVSATATNYGQDAHFRWHSSGWAAWLERLRNEYLPGFGATAQRPGWDGKGAPRRSRPAPPEVETRQDRERKIARIGIYPGDVEIKTGEQVVFNAIAFDQDGNAIGGLDLKWSALHEEKNHPLTITSHGTFVSGAPGKFIVTAEIAGRKERVKVTVTGEARGTGLRSRSEASKSSSESRRVSSLRAPVSGDQKRIAGRGKRKGMPALPGPLSAASAPMAASRAIVIDGDDEGWHSGNHGSAYSIENALGYVPGSAIDGGVGSSNFQFSAPAVAMDGRIDLNLLLNYNSRVWHKAGAEMTFDIDRGRPGAGWTLGFGKIVMAGDTYMFVDGAGTRHPYTGSLRRGFPAPASSLQTFEGRTTTLIDYYAEGYQTQFESGGRNMIMAWAVMPDGTRIEYGAKANYAMYPTKITDKNGNFITITYRNNEGPDIQSIVEPNGRVILFHYDMSGLLTAIKVPGLGGGQRVAVRLQYQWMTLSNAGANYGFAGWMTTKVRQNTIPVIRAIYYPATNTGYWFGADAYSPYGMICKVREHRGMTFNNAPLNEQGNISPGTMSREMVYNYPQSGGSYNDMPTYTQMTEDWAGRTTPSAPVTQYSVVDNGATLTTTITRPDGAQLEQITDNNQSSGTYGMLLEDELSHNGVTLSRSKASWEVGAYNAPRPTRMETTDERGQTMVTTYSYDPAYGSLYNAPTDKRVYGFSGELLRHEHTEYLNNGNYNGSLQNSGTLWWKQGGGLFGGPVWSGSHIFNLISVSEVYDGVTRLSREEYRYDSRGLTDTPGIAQYNSWYNPHTPDLEVCEQIPDPNDFDCRPCQDICPIGDGACEYLRVCNYYPQYDPKTLYRGNITEIKRYADAVNLNQETASVETLTYDVAGNLREKSASCCDKTSYTYTANTQYAWLESQTTGALSDPSKQNSSSATYDYSTGLVMTSTDANGRVSQTIYDQNTLRPVDEYSPTGAYRHHIYDDLNLSVSEFVYEAGQGDGNFASRSDKRIDGVGRVVKEIAYGKDYVLDVIETKFDNLGRAWRRTRPYRANSDGSPAETVQWATMTYDSLDRPVQTASPDGSVVTRAYNQSPDPAASSGLPGSTVKVTDSWGRQQWGRWDAGGRMVEVAEPNPGVTGSLSEGAMFTAYSYDARDHLIRVDQGEQTRIFGYDGLDRLTHQKLAERDAKLNAAGQWVEGGQWSDVFFYDTRSNLIRRVDARGVQALYDFNDPLNRLLAVQYSKSGVPGHLSGAIPDAPNVSYSYMTTGDKMRSANIVVSNGMGNEQLSYDSEGRLAQVRQTFSGRESYPILTNYLWDSLDRLKESLYPQQYGAGDIRKKVEPVYDIASRIESLKFGGVSYASNPVYNAASQTTSLNVGSQIKELSNYDLQTGLVTNQQVKRGADFLVDLKYNYTLNNDPSNNGAKTGRLTGITDLKNQARNQAYEYDKLGRLVKVKSGVDAFSNPTWQQSYTYDKYGNQGLSGQAGGQPNETVWFDDGLPAGAIAGATGGDGWNWASSSPGPKSGSVSHISNLADWSNWSPPPYSGSLSHQSNIASGFHQHQYFSAPAPIPVRAGGKLYAYVYIDPRNIPDTLMLQWGTTTDGWEHRAFWGEDRIGLGTPGTASRRYMGPLPQAGGWVRLDVLASVVGLEGLSVNAMAFTLYGGRANWDLAGIEGVNYVTWQECYWDCAFDPCFERCENITQEQYENYVLADDNLPLGAASGGDGGDGWNWRGANNVEMVHQHYFDNATATLQVGAGDTLFSWVYLDPAKPPSEVMLQWNVNGSWEHRAYWGANEINWGADETTSRRYMGALPQSGEWVKLAIPASAVGLENKSISGMAFTLFGGRAAWDKVGKTSGPPVAPPNPPNLVMGRDGFENLTYSAVNNRITSSGFGYDNHGNQTSAVIDNSGTVQQYRYDCANRLVQVSDASGNILATHAYGASNQRLMSVEGGVTTYSAWAGGKVIAEYVASGANALVWKTSYVFMGERLLATTSGIDGTETRFHHPGRLGARLTTDAAGTVVTEQWTMPFGNMQAFTSVPGGENPYQHPALANPSKKRFTSYDRRAVGPDYALNRHYSPAQGRFTQVDPIGMSAVNLENPQTLNLFAYCANDPINRLDPDGLGFWSVFRKVIRIIAAVVAVAIAIVSIVALPAAIAAAQGSGLAIWGAVAGAVANAANATSRMLGLVGHGKLSAIFGLIGSGFGFMRGGFPGLAKKKFWDFYGLAVSVGQDIASLAGNAKVGTAFALAGIPGYIRGIKQKLTDPVDSKHFPAELIKITEAIQSAANWLFSSHWTNFYKPLTRALHLPGNIHSINGAINGAKDNYFPKKKEELAAGNGAIADLMQRRSSPEESDEAEVFPGRPVMALRLRSEPAF